MSSNSEGIRLSTLDLPPEILGRIFIAFHTHWQPSYHCHPCLIPVRLASVCRYWRQVALGTSELWTTCWLFYTHPEMNSLWMSRAGTRSLNIQGQRHIVSKPRPVPADRLLASIIPFAQYFTALVLDLECIASHESADDYQIDVPNLLSIYFKNNSTTAPRWLTNLLRGAPKLKKLNGFAYEKVFDCVLPNLIHLEVQSIPDTTEFDNILSKANKLITFRANDIRGHARDFSTSTIHLSLVHLQIGFDDMAVFNSLTLPHLKALVISYSGPTLTVEDLLPLIQFLNRSQCAIENFQTRIRECCSLFTVLQHPSLSSLISLKHSNMILDNSMMRFLSETTKNLPRLRRLLLDEVILDNLDFSLVGDMIAARRVPVGGGEEWKRSRLEYFEWTFDDMWDYGTKAYRAEVQRIKGIAESTKGETGALFLGLPTVLLSPVKASQTP